MVELPPPDRELRQQLVERTLAGRGQEADAELVTYIASRPAESARAVQGYVQRVAAHGGLAAGEARRGLAREVLEGGATGRAEGQRAGPHGQRVGRRRRAG